MSVDDIVMVIRRELERQSTAGPPGPFVPFVRDVRIVEPELGRVLIDGHVNLTAIAEAILSASADAEKDKE